MRAQRPGESALLLLDAVDVLAEAGVHYAVIGAMAAAVHGVVRASIDADAVLAASPSGLSALEHRFRALGLQTELRYGDADDPISALLELTDAHDNRIDLLVGIKGFDPQAFSRAIEVPFHGAILRVIGLEDFIATKIFAHGPQDLVDARVALDVQKGRIDLDLLRQVAARFGRETSDELEKLIGER